MGDGANLVTTRTAVDLLKIHRGVMVQRKKTNSNALARELKYYTET
ncbi:hypothetical protein APHCRT_0482 [Anaplasma phagocytophilum str. CRT53-1]|uniref:Uncharacterized protein n=1 Tax=Anaplasma phagocytophilum str. CRT53-1 TaxID=1359157 RepID=A0A0F3Q350_ANAPH|nr:hypothetical protein APHCRT_0482 [Anaplasma phagocytophilum str. CRT53-1]